MNVKKQFVEGLITQNPVLVQLLGIEDENSSL